MPSALRFEFTSIRSGWCFVTISDGLESLSVSGSRTPVDSIEVFLDSIQSLTYKETSDCCWFQGPGELHWRFARSGDQLTIKITEYRKSLMSGHHAEADESVVFVASGKWRRFALQVANSIDAQLRHLGADGYEREWRRPFPQDSYRALRSAIESKPRTT